jgi:hypothetical protein
MLSTKLYARANTGVVCVVLTLLTAAILATAYGLLGVAAEQIVAWTAP